MSADEREALIAGWSRAVARATSNPGERIG
jgi:hypothetical protein